MVEKNKQTIDEQLKAAGVAVPEGTSDEVKEMLLTKHLEAEEYKSKSEKLSSDKDQLAKEASEENAKLREALKDSETKAAAHEGFGTFKVDKASYIISAKQFQMFDQETRSRRKVTAEELLEDKDLQAELVKSKSGIVVPKKDWDARNKKGGK